MKQPRKTKKALESLSLTYQEQLLGWAYLAAELLVLPVVIAAIGLQFGGFSDSTANFLYYLTNAVCCAVIFRRLLRESLLRAGQRIGTLLCTALAGFLLLLGANQVMTGLALAVNPAFVNLNNRAIASMVLQTPLLMTVGTVILVPMAEECLFRGLLFLPLLKKNRWGAYALSALAFCAVHVVGYVGEADALTLAVCFAQYLPAGLVLAASCEASGSLFTPILIHAAVNAGSIIALR